MNYEAGAASLVGLCIACMLMLATLSWLNNRKHARLPLYWLLLLTTLIALQSLEFLYHATDAFIPYPFFLKAVDPLVVLLPMALYGYIRALQGDSILTSWRSWLLHTSPAILTALLAIEYWLMPASERIDLMLAVRVSEREWQSWALYGNDYLALIALCSVVYWLLQRQHGVVQKNKDIQRWVMQLQAIQLIMAVSLTLRIVFSAGFNWHISMVFVLSPVCLYLLYLMLGRAQLPHSASQTNAVLKKSTLPPNDPNSASVMVSDHDESHAHELFFHELTQCMEQGAYRDSQLSLQSLAQQAGITTHQASAAINQCAGHHFYDWLNQYRIQAAQEQLRLSETAITQICYDVGYNSKSTFNVAFRKWVGCTPSEYRRGAQSERMVIHEAT